MILDLDRTAQDRTETVRVPGTDMQAACLSPAQQIHESCYFGDFYKTAGIQAANSNSSKATPPREGLNQWARRKAARGYQTIKRHKWEWILWREQPRLQDRTRVTGNVSHVISWVTRLAASNQENPAWTLLTANLAETQIIQLASKGPYMTRPSSVKTTSWSLYRDAIRRKKLTGRGKK